MSICESSWGTTFGLLRYPLERNFKISSTHTCRKEFVGHNEFSDLLKSSFQSHSGGIVNNTLRPPIPSSCDAEWRRLMEQCWAPDPTARPSFTEIVSRLRQMALVTQDKSTGSSGSKSGSQARLPWSPCFYEGATCWYVFILYNITAFAGRLAPIGSWYYILVRVNIEF